jgi:DNA-binding transcriptional regulator YiaG
MDKEIEIFREEVARWRGGRLRGARRYPDAMRVRALRLWERLRQQGMSAVCAAERLGISTITLSQWCGGTARPQLVPVQLIREERQVSARPLQVFSPRGYRVEVPDVGTAAALLRELG